MHPAPGGPVHTAKSTRLLQFILFRSAGSQHLLQLVVHELHLGADDDLASVLAGTDDTGSTGSLDSLLVNLSVVEHLKAQTGCAVTNVLHVLLAADSSQHSRSDFGVVVVSQSK